jgi:hypothetical protein
MSYIEKYRITPEKLQQQYISPDIVAVPPEGFPEWLDARAGRLAAAANELLGSLREGL